MVSFFNFDVMFVAPISNDMAAISCAEAKWGQALSDKKSFLTSSYVLACQWVIVVAIAIPTAVRFPIGGTVTTEITFRHREESPTEGFSRNDHLRIPNRDLSLHERDDLFLDDLLEQTIDGFDVG
ncbi:hypothetical protein WICPIJ_004154 [Wickerhamomyces pijperi]|uniref:Uncharacterized protein n=1 Tax=Wickerhamomyces pijperi TaxID=599730 RepID=A0A9P8TNJ6_WICPI|nr:hypothetical protein WICPIJ_004154 [Wickerhamomyces pijperi]